MKQQDLKIMNLVVIFSLAFGSILGCDRARVVTYDVTKSGKNWTESETVQESRGRGGKRIIEKQYVHEKVGCVNKNNRKIKAASPEDCIRKGGRVVDETLIEEQMLERR